MPTDTSGQQHTAPTSASERRTPTVRELVSAMENIDLSLAYDELANEPIKTDRLPWDESTRRRPWSQLDDAELFAHFQEEMGLRSEKDLDRAAVIYAHRRSFNPLTDMLDNIEWDGIERAGSLLINYLGAENTTYTSAVERTLLCGGIARAYKPGCKFDFAPVLTGRGGIGKSTFARRLALGDRYFTDSVYDLGNIKTTGEVLRGKWIVELSELGGIKGRPLEAVKAGITRQTDTFRVAYGKRSTDFPRRSIFIGTTNTIGFIAERSSGARRFLPVLCGVNPATKSVHSGEFKRDAQQAWAEVLAWMRTDDPRFSLALSPEMELEAARQREGFLEEDPRVDVIKTYLDANRDHLVCTREIIDRALHMEPTQKLSRDVSDILSNQCPGWSFAGKRKCGTYGKQRSWEYRSLVPHLVPISSAIGTSTYALKLDARRLVPEVPNMPTTSSPVLSAPSAPSEKLKVNEREDHRFKGQFRHVESEPERSGDTHANSENDSNHDSQQRYRVHPREYRRA